ncbi:hypothetical protein [Mangrovibacterium diazotrophicum]|uniref:Carboxypeptidase-like protein n=1 Tax=Mangrovibacterium diazotrophicum TaxID=1261403 RepID=A0A419W403_9BACT|nr:hypothetical protein [Mangrovibacterium diazotrophicum]RKD90184.1 hypothetical protein BC643_0520 [Mangrovibacterium diazotrophicum]
MKYPLLFITILLFCTSTSVGQTRTITGKVIGAEPCDCKSKYDEFFIIREAKILSTDSIELGTTNENGKFEIQVSNETNELLIGWIGMEWEKVKITKECNNYEVILLPFVIYDFVSTKKANRLRKKDREVLPELYQRAYNEEIFENEKPCR